MPVLRYSESKSRHYVQSLLHDQTTSYRLISEGIRYLVVELGIDDDESFDADVLKHLIQKGWAFPESAEDAPREIRTKVDPTLDQTPRSPSPKASAPVAAYSPKAPPAPVAPVSAPARVLTPREKEAQRAQSRTRGRMVALQVLYQIEQNPGVDPREVERFVNRRLRDPQIREFTRALIAGVQNDQTRIDTLISEVAENWRIDRMAAIDRNILRLGAFELLSSKDVPAKVAINEALELAKRYSTAQSSRFVNGILDRLLAAEAEGKTRAAAELEALAEPKPADPVEPAAVAEVEARAAEIPSPPPAPTSTSTTEEGSTAPTSTPPPTTPDAS